ncbi:GSCFA domain-containing protein [Pricia sp.]|uniref:GSCFA domain-containing protein n=1 Tax=Pricia sp. TaxID=2268138 RepID=UPI003593E493
MKLQTQIPLKKAENQIGYDSGLVLLGSCFVKNMGRKFEYFKFRQLQNPFGILFHPLAIEQLISGAIRDESYSETDIFYLNGLWHCFDAHSNLSDASEDNLLKKLNDGLEATRSKLDTASHIIITLGTAWVYQHSASGGVVANCHKVPQREFSKELMPIPEIVNSLGRTIKLVRSVNPSVQLIFTISPVRHLKDGFVENQWSKAHLISAVQQICHHSEEVMADRAEGTDSNLTHSHLTDIRLIENGQISYFPSYEIMMDELRDYRFYERDMVHPNSIAIDYIWEKFKQTWISEQALTAMEKIDDIQKGLQHRPFNPGSEQHTKFREALETKIAIIRQEYPFMDF